MPDIYVQLEVNSQNLWSRYDDHFMSIAWQGVQAHSFMYSPLVVKLLNYWQRIYPWPDLQNILRQSYDYLTIMPKLRSTYDRRLIYKTSYKDARLSSDTIHLQNREIV